MDTNKLAKSSNRKAEIYRGAKCLNCQHPLELTDKYCANCSQLNTTKQLALKDFFNEFFSSIFTYDSRLRYTLKDLLFKPGTITKNYVNGQRLKYANPFRFFLSVSIVYFILQGLITSITGSSDIIKFNADGTDAVNLIELKDEIQKGTNNLNFNIDSLNQAIDSIVNTNAEKVNKKDSIKQVEEHYITENELDTLNWFNNVAERFSLYRTYYKETKIKNAETALDSLNHYKTATNKWLYNKNDAIDRIGEDPFGFASYLMNKIPFFLFFFAPFFALFFWVLFSSKKYSYMEHLVFIFHIFSFMFLASLICLIPDTIFKIDIFIAVLMFLIAPFYFYKALRNFYKQSRIITIIKFVFLNIVFFISSSIAALLFIIVSAAVY